MGRLALMMRVRFGEEREEVNDACEVERLSVRNLVDLYSMGITNSADAGSKLNQF